MTTIYNDGAAAPGPVTPIKSDEALAGDTAQGSKVQDNGQGDCASAALADLQGRAARVGLDVHEIADGSLRVTYAAFGEAGHLCIVPSVAAGVAFVARCEIELAEFREALDCVRGGAGATP